MRIKITGYIEPEDDETDVNSPDGLTSAAYDDLIAGLSGRPLQVSDLEDVEVENPEVTGNYYHA